MKWETKTTGRLIVTDDDMIIIKDIMAGIGAKKTAEKLFISHRTMEYRIKQLKDHFKVKSKAGIAVAAFAYGLIDYEKPSIF
jgi:DNA-binding NarL/FixJ family response regulator